MTRDIVDRLRDAAEVEGGTSPDYGGMLEDAADTIAALIAKLKTVAEMGCRNCAPTRAEWKKCQAERDEWKACFLSMREERDSWQSRHALRVRIEHAEIRALKAERDKLLKDRSDLAQQIDNDTDCIAKLKEADDLDIMPTLAKAYREIAELKEEVERLNNELNIEQMDSLTGREWAKNLKAENLELRSYSQASTQTYQEQIAKLKKEVELVRAERHRAQTACAQMGERVSVLTEALQTVRTAIIEKAPDTLWAGLIETAVDHIDNALSRTSEDAK
jgi:chromosome segregation ATPase